jgi:hypothetical protein
MSSRSAIEACVVGGHTCADECERHAAHHDYYCRFCMEFVACHEAAVRCARDPTASRAWTSCTAIAPSPTAVAQRLLDP